MDKIIDEIGELIKIKEPALSIYASLKLPTECQETFPANVTAKEIVTVLIEKEQFLTCLKFIIKGIPKREAAWWGLLCVKQSIVNSALQETHEATLKAIEEWVYHPTDNNRRVMPDLAKKQHYRTASSWVAMAVFWSGGSITPPHAPEVLPSPHLSCHALISAMKLAAISVTGHQDMAIYQRFLRQGLDIANNGNGDIH